MSQEQQKTEWRPLTPSWNGVCNDFIRRRQAGLGGAIILAESDVGRRGRAVIWNTGWYNGTSHIG